MSNEPAFPSHGTMGEVSCEGMTLRDYFAAKAMQGLIHDWAGIDIKVMTSNAYEIADAMMKTREEGDSEKN